MMQLELIPMLNGGNVEHWDCWGKGQVTSVTLVKGLISNRAQIGTANFQMQFLLRFYS